MQLKKINALLATLFLSGCEVIQLAGAISPLINTVYVGDVMVTSATLAQNLALHNIGLINSPRRGEILIAEFARESWRDDGRGKCIFKGYMTGFDREWGVVVNQHSGVDDVLPPTPSKTEGQAVIFTQKICKNKPIERMLRIGEYSYLKDASKLPDGRVLKTQALDEISADKRPLWVDSVFRNVVLRAADGDPIAIALQSEMLEYVEESKARKQVHEVTLDWTIPSHLTKVAFLF